MGGSKQWVGASYTWEQARCGSKLDVRVSNRWEQAMGGSKLWVGASYGWEQAIWIAAANIE